MPSGLRPVLGGAGRRENVHTESKIAPPPTRRSRRHCGFQWGNGQKKSQPIRVGTLSIGGVTRNRTRVRFPKRIVIEPASVRVFRLMFFFLLERYQTRKLELALLY